MGKNPCKIRRRIMSESHFDQYEHYNFDQDKAMYSGHSGKQRSKKEAALNTNHHNPGGHERKIVTKLMNAEKMLPKKPRMETSKTHAKSTPEFRPVPMTSGAYQVHTIFS